MAEFSYDKLLKLVKSDKDITQGKAATALGLSIGQISMVNFCKAQVEAKVYTTAPATATSVKKLRDSEGNRWELIAARTDLSVAAVKTKYEEAGGDASKSYTGKGRNFSGGASTAKRSTASSARTTAKRTTAKRSNAKRTTAKRSGAGGKNTTVKRNTTGGRRSTAGNPS